MNTKLKTVNEGINVLIAAVSKRSLSAFKVPALRKAREFVSMSKHPNLVQVRTSIDCELSKRGKS